MFEKVVKAVKRAIVRATQATEFKLLCSVHGELLTGKGVSVVPVVAGCIRRVPQHRGNMMQRELS